MFTNEEIEQTVKMIRTIADLARRAEKAEAERDELRGKAQALVTCVQEGIQTTRGGRKTDAACRDLAALLAEIDAAREGEEPKP